MGEFIHIQDGHRDRILGQVKRLFDRYHTAIDETYTTNENEIKITFKTIIKPLKTSGLKVKTAIDFYTGKITDSTEDDVFDGPKQAALQFPEKKKQPPARRPWRMTPGQRARMRMYSHH